MAVAPLVDPDPRGAAVVLGRPTLTNRTLADAFAAFGYEARIEAPENAATLGPADVAVARIDVLPELDGVEAGLWRLPLVARDGARLFNGPVPLLAAHDKLLTALMLGRAGVPHPRTAHARDASAPAFAPPYVVKPRFGSWGRDVYLCRTVRELADTLTRLHERDWFRRQGALVQELVGPTGRDHRLVVAGGRVIGAVERIAPPGEWRTNVALGALRRRTRPPQSACALALGAVAALGLDLAGVDLLVGHDGRELVLEVNGAVDFTYDYADDVFVAAVAALLGTTVDDVGNGHAAQGLSLDVALSHSC